MKTLAAFAVIAISAAAQVHTFTREQMIRYTAKNPYERFEDGRPKVPDALLEKFKTLTSEEIWGMLPGFPNQYEGNWRVLHPGKKLVGRAVTVQFMPYRPDVAEIADSDGKARYGGRGPNQRVIDQLRPGDVIVVDLYGKIDGGTFVGDNLATYIAATTKTGMVIDGAVRDLEGIFPLDFAAYFRGVHPSALAMRDGVMLTGLNVPVRIGNATVLPGDVVFGDREGITFVPPQFVQKVLDRAEETHIHDEWTQEKLRSGKYKSSEIYSSPTDPALRKEYEEYKKKRLEKK